MTVAQTVNLSALKRAKNTVIGNPTAKAGMAKDDAFIRTLVDCINNPPLCIDTSQGSSNDVQIEAAHVIASLSYGSSDALESLLKANAHHAFLCAMSTFPPSGPSALKAAFARGLRAVVAAIAEVVGPSQWGLQDHPSEFRNEARTALDYLFEIDALDIYLPLLAEPSSQTSASIAQLLASAVRSRPYRSIVSEWLPPMERNKEVKGKRGWEKSDTSSPGRQGGWVAKQLIALLQRKDTKLQEAALSALASLAKDNPPVATKLARAPDQPTVLSMVLSHCKSRLTNIQTAACLCATSIIRAGLSFHSLQTDQMPAMTVTHVVNRLLASDSETPQARSKACFILYQLVSDEKDLCLLTFKRGSLTHLANLVKSITPSENVAGWDEDEPESTACLREAALTAIAAIALFENDIRCDLTDNQGLIPYIKASLLHRHVGVRYAACQCVRALSRAVAVLRTSIIDAGLGLAVYQILKKSDEDKRVTFAASAVMCNVLNDFSPLRATLLKEGVIERLVQLLNADDPGLRMNALWAFKNLLYKSTSELKRRVVRKIGWPELTSSLMDPDPGIQEQALHVVRHIADGEEGIEMVFNGLGEQSLLEFLSAALDSENEDVLHQAVCVLGNIANSYPHQQTILSHPRILSSLRACLVDAKVEVRRPAAACVLELARAIPRRHKELREAGIDLTLRRICDFGTPALSASPTARFSAFQMGVEDDSEVKETAKEALSCLEGGG